MERSQKFEACEQQPKGLSNYTTQQKRTLNNEMNQGMYTIFKSTKLNVKIKITDIVEHFILANHMEEDPLQDLLYLFYPINWNYLPDRQEAQLNSTIIHSNQSVIPYVESIGMYRINTQRLYSNRFHTTYTYLRTYSPNFLQSISHIAFNQLKYLSLYKSNIINIQPIGWLNSEKLQILQIDRKYVKSFQPLGKTNFSKLRKLQISQNNVCQSQHSYLCRMKTSKSGFQVQIKVIASNVGLRSLLKCQNIKFLYSKSNFNQSIVHNQILRSGFYSQDVIISSILQTFETDIELPIEKQEIVVYHMNKMKRKKNKNDEQKILKKLISISLIKGYCFLLLFFYKNSKDVKQELINFFQLLQRLESKLNYTDNFLNE